MSVCIPVARRSSPLGATLVILAVGACTGADDVVLRGLLCDECRAESQRIVDLGDAAGDPLRVALREGPSAAVRNNYRAQAAEEHRLARRAKNGQLGGLSVLSDSAPFVDGALDNLVASYQKRAAWSLRAIGTTAARLALHEARVDNANGQFLWRADVRSLVELIDSDDPITSVTVTSPVAVLPLAGTAQLTAKVSGVIQVAQTVVWTSTNSALATITSGGVVTRVGSGPAVGLRACSSVRPTVCGVAVIGMP